MENVEQLKTKLSNLETIINDDFIDEVELAVGMGHRAWDMVDPKKICQAIIETFLCS